MFFVGLLVVASSANAFLVGSGHLPPRVLPCTAAPSTLALQTNRLVVLGLGQSPTSESNTSVIIDHDKLDSPFLQEADAIFDAIDANCDGAISNDELRSHLGGIGYSQEVIRGLFTALDKNADGVISREEMRFAFENYETSSLCKALGVGDARLTDEMYGVTVESIRASANPHALEAADEGGALLLAKLADLIFDMIDTDNSGEIDTEELKSHFLKNGNVSTFREIGNVSAVSAEAVMKALDLNHDGVISREEMRDGFRQYDLQALSKALGMQVSRT